MVDAGEPTEPTVALKLIPEMRVLQPFQMSLPKLIADADRRLAAVRSQLKSMDSVQEPRSHPQRLGPGARLGREFEAVANDLTKARQEAQDALAAAEPVAARGKADVAALDRVARWREYVDLVSRRSLERRAAESGAEGVQAYYIENESGRFGPFQFEQPVDLGGGDVVVRSHVRNAIEVRNPAEERTLAEGKDGAATVTLPGPEPGAAPPSGMTDEWGNPVEDAPPPEKSAGFRTTFRLTERCDDLLVQFDFLRRQTAENILQKEEVAFTSTSWCGQFCRLLALDASRSALKKELGKISTRWRLTMMDLAALSPVKERLATYFLVARASEIVPPLAQALTEAKATLKETERTLGEIAKRCSRDVDTDRLIVPPKLSEAYNRENARARAPATRSSGRARC